MFSGPFTDLPDVAVLLSSSRVGVAYGRRCGVLSTVISVVVVGCMVTPLSAGNDQQLI